MVKQWEAESIAIQRKKAATLRRRALRRRMYACFGVCVLAYGGLFAWWIEHTNQVLRWQQALDSQLQRLVVASGLTVRHVRIDGQQNISPQQILQQAHIDPKQLIVSLSLSDIRTQLLEHPQIASANVTRHLPNRIEIEVTERAPAALWQNEGKKWLLDKEGVRLKVSHSQLAALAPLMVVTGYQADKALPSLWPILQASPDVASKIKAVHWVGNRRWTVWTQSGAKIMLPMSNPQQAFAKIAQWHAETGLLDRAVSQIDLRVEGMAYVRYQQDQDITPPAQKPLLTAAVSGAI